jgi:hypothetical protein
MKAHNKSHLALASAEQTGRAGKIYISDIVDDLTAQQNTVFIEK